MIGGLLMLLCWGGFIAAHAFMAAPGLRAMSVCFDLGLWLILILVSHWTSEKS